MPAHVLERQIDEVRRGVDRDRVSVWQRQPSDGREPLAVLPEDRDAAGLGGDVQQPQPGIEGQHVGIVAHGMRLEHLARCEVDHRECGVALPGHERQAAGGIECDPVWFLHSGQGNTSRDLCSDRIDDRQLRGLRDGNQDLA